MDIPKPDWAKCEGSLGARPPMPVARQFYASEYDETCQQAMAARIERHGLSAMATLVAVPKFMTGGAGKFVSADEWTCPKYGTFNLSEALEARIAELGVSPGKVRAHIERRVDWIEERRFRRQTFEQQMETLKWRP
jgi:hypothetical protein